MRALLAPLAGLYGVGLAAKNLAYDQGLLRARRLKQPVISMGNLSVGGSGKTPLVIALARLLEQNGLAVDVLSRGYGRRSRATLRVDAGDPEALGRFGDEPLLIAEAARCPVYVAPRRFDAGRLAESEASRVHILDDGLQHRKLARDVDIVVLHRTDFSGRLLPQGRLREPLSALGRASALVLRAEDRVYSSTLRARGLRAPIWLVERRVEVPEFVRGVAFCGIARPEEFFGALPAKRLRATRAFRDHHRYMDGDLEALAGLARQHDADALITTEKDLVRLSPAQRATLAAAAPLRPARLVVRFEDESAVLAFLLGSIGQARATA